MHKINFNESKWGYGVQRFGLYVLFGLVINFIFIQQAVIVAVPSVLICALVVAFTDVLSIAHDPSKWPQVFTRRSMRVLLVMAIIAIIVNGMDFIRLRMNQGASNSMMDYYIVSGVLMLGVSLNFIRLVRKQDISKERMLFAVGRFVFYGLFGVVGANFPWFMVGLVVGFPSILLLACVLATMDAQSFPPQMIHDPDTDDSLIFTQNNMMTLIAYALLIVFYVLFSFYMLNTN